MGRPAQGPHGARRLRLLGGTAVAALLAAGAGSASAAQPRVDARAWLVQNPSTGEVLASHDARRRVAIASITKLMTVLVALEQVGENAVVTVDPRAATVGESTVALRPGERISVRDLVAASLVQSANDAAWALAFHVGEGDAGRFVAAMNATARRLGMRDTRFVRPDGLDTPGHVSSARDAVVLARAAMREPLVRRLVRQQLVVAAGRVLETWNDLLGRFPGLIGVKTGHTAAAGWSQVAAVRRGRLVLYAAILGSPTREARNAALARLLRFGLSRYRAVEAVPAGRVYGRAALPYGRPSLALVARRPLTRLVRVDRPLVERVVVPTAVDLPVRRGQRLGEVRIYHRGRLLGRRDLVAARSVPEPGLRARVGWYAGRTLDHLAGLFT
ncbi:MAG: D-alanyl-D-alanine carboxypeptidase [Thermoleophilia bacterium]|nr:D-alanyl-D-alanine carboxypeptidase [Thermoleophilia bacterium]